MFKVGDRVVRAPEHKNDWWSSRTNGRPNGTFVVMEIRGESSVELLHENPSFHFECAPQRLERAEPSPKDKHIAKVKSYGTV